MKKKVTTITSCIAYKLVTSLAQDLGTLINSCLRCRPIILIHRVTDSREERLVIARPLLWRKDDMFELLPTRKLGTVSNRNSI